MAVAIAFFFANLVGLGLGPLIAGSLCDLFGQSLGEGEGLRYALIVVMTTFLPYGAFMLYVGRHLRTDAEA